MENFIIKKGQTYSLGATPVCNGIQFAAVVKDASAEGIVLIHKASGERSRIPFTQGNCVGNIASLLAEGLNPEEFEYNFYNETGEYTDPYAKRVFGNELWGKKEQAPLLRGGFAEDADGVKEVPLCIPFHESILYCLHVRGFTKHESSGVKHKGTFLGLAEKVKYLKKLGITAVELLPAYEFEEYEIPAKKKDGMMFLQEKNIPSLNYWGFKKGFYFAPKASYAAGTDAVAEFKDMVKTLHQNGIEVVMQFYFPDSVQQGMIPEVIRYWVTQYGIDGVHLKGNKVPIALLATDPLLAKTKIFYHYIPEGELCGYDSGYRNLCVYSDDFMYKMRRFLKGDEDMLMTMAGLTRNTPPHWGCVNFITNYYGFTLQDLVSYDRKHNEMNGEENRDGAEFNYSWNCGMEGKTRKKAILALRKKMMQNAFLLMLLSGGTPVLNAGDEFCNSQEGNNNPYCQDNEITWLNWNAGKAGKEMTEFVANMIAYRKQCFYLQRTNDFTMLDRYHCGYPDLSYHGEEAWKADFSSYQRHIGMLYSKSDVSKKETELEYVAYNMHWEEKNFYLPAPPRQKCWCCRYSTDEVNELEENGFCVSGRSIAIFTLKDAPKEKK
ncbi:MAG: hypothetical protein IJ291_07560 [Lachnospiraceae bacterium]|nr:hypothetical protein [Lachnospiraceae bacterium]